MSHEIALIVAFSVPLLAMTVLRINAAMVFLSLCLGAVLVEYVAGEANSLVSLFTTSSNSISASSMKLALLLAPAAATCVFTLFSVRGRLKVSINILPAAGASLLAILLAVPLFAPGLRFALQSEALWRHLTKAQALVVGVGALVSLVFLWMQRSSFRSPEKHRR